MNGNDFIKINQTLGKQVELLEKKLGVAIVGLKAIISEDSASRNIAEKTIKEIDSYKLPQANPRTEE